MSLATVQISTLKEEQQHFLLNWYNWYDSGYTYDMAIILEPYQVTAIIVYARARVPIFGCYISGFLNFE